jgi:hypothetical protein
MVNNRAVYPAIGMRCSGHKEILGLWIEQTEGAKFWLRVMTELRNRGTQDILIAVVHGLKGFRQAITSVFPKTVVQTCIVHLLRYSMHFASWKDRKAVAAALNRSTSLVKRAVRVAPIRRVDCGADRGGNGRRPDLWGFRLCIEWTRSNRHSSRHRMRPAQASSFCRKSSWKRHPP